jgi:hypothetical protein
MTNSINDTHSLTHSWLVINGQFYQAIAQQVVFCNEHHIRQTCDNNLHPVISAYYVFD